MCQQCTQRAVELEGKLQALKEETLKLASEASLRYSDVGALGASSAIVLMSPMLLTEGQLEDVILAVRTSAHVLNEADNLLQELFGKSMELGMLRSVQEALYMAETQTPVGDEFGLSHGRATKKPTVH